MALSSRPNRTWLCSVVFMDIANYTTHSITHQIAMKNRFIEIVQSIAKHHFSDSDLFIVDAGDGGALCYLGDPEDMLFCTRDLMNAFEAVKEEAPFSLPVRIGINLGPVKIHTNVAGQPNPIGDGINVAQRVMSFAQAGQILVSRSFYEVVGCLSDEYSCMFEHVGIRRDKHVRQHDLYRVRSSDEAQISLPSAELADTSVGDAPAPSEPLSASPCLAQKAIEKELVHYLGPIGKILVRRELTSRRSPQDALEHLAARIPDLGQRNSFLNRALMHLRETHVDAQQSQPHAPALPGTSRRPKPDISHWNERELEIAANHLRGYIGPIAKALVHRVAAHARNIEELYTQLAYHIPVEVQRATFLREVGLDDGGDPSP